MEMRIMWEALVENYFHKWTADGVTPSHASEGAVRAWLDDEARWTDADRRFLGDLGEDDLAELSADIAERVRDELGETLAEEMERAKAYHGTMQFLYNLAEETNNDDIYEAYHLMAKTEGDLFSPAVYYDPAVVRPEDDPSDLEPWVTRIVPWHDSEGKHATAYTDCHALLLDPYGCLSCYTDDEYMPERMLWSFGPDEIPEHLKPLYKMMKDAKEAC